MNKEPSVHCYIVEVDAFQIARELAEGATEDELLGTEGFLDEEDLYITEVKYHPDVQRVYDRWYNYYLSVIERAKI